MTDGVLVEARGAGDLFNALATFGRNIGESTILGLARQIISAVAYLHEQCALRARPRAMMRVSSEPETPRQAPRGLCHAPAACGPLAASLP